jgi:hypothetical protein
MMARCENANHHSYHRYGGRGITICETWHDFAGFLSDMGERPDADHSLDRIDNDRGYGPGNCRWATRVEQQRNRRNNRIITIDGLSLCVAEWAERTGINHESIRGRLRRGLTDRAAVFGE